jgi:hypothetical protein
MLTYPRYCEAPAIYLLAGFLDDKSTLSRQFKSSIRVDRDKRGGTLGLYHH